MATSSEIKAALDDIATEIRNERSALKQVKARIDAAVSILNGLPSKYSGVIASIDALAGADAFEQLSKAEKAKLAAEFNALKTKATSAQTALAAIDFNT